MFLSSSSSFQWHYTWFGKLYRAVTVSSNTALTLVLASSGAPRSRSSSTTWSWPLLAAQWSGVSPSLKQNKGKEMSTSSSVHYGTLRNTLATTQPHKCVKKLTYWLLTEAGSITWSFLPIFPCTKITVLERKPTVCWKSYQRGWCEHALPPPLCLFCMDLRLYCLSG